MDFTIHGLVKTFWMRNEAGKNFNSSYFARHACTIAGIPINTPCTMIQADEFCQLVSVFLRIVPYGNVNFKHLLHLKAASNIKTHVQKRDLKSVLEQVKNPRAVRESLIKYYESALKDFVDTQKPDAGMHDLPSISQEFEEFRDFSTERGLFKDFDSLSS